MLAGCLTRLPTSALESVGFFFRNSRVLPSGMSSKRLSQPARSSEWDSNDDRAPHTKWEKKSQITQSTTQCVLFAVSVRWKRFHSSPSTCLHCELLASSKTPPRTHKTQCGLFTRTLFSSTMTRSSKWGDLQLIVYKHRKNTFFPLSSFQQKTS